MTCTSYPKALDCFSNLKTPPATKPTPVCLDASPLVMMQSTSDLSIHGIAPLAEKMGNVLRWLEISQEPPGSNPALGHPSVLSRGGSGRAQPDTCPRGHGLSPSSPCTRIPGDSSWIPLWASQEENPSRKTRPFPGPCRVLKEHTLTFQHEAKESATR